MSSAAPKPAEDALKKEQRNVGNGMQLQPGNTHLKDKTDKP
jgi:hypothetical protein